MNTLKLKLRFSMLISEVLSLPLQFTSVSVTLGSGFALLLFEHIVDSNLVTVKLTSS